MCFPLAFSRVAYFMSPVGQHDVSSVDNIFFCEHFSGESKNQNQFLIFEEIIFLFIYLSIYFYLFICYCISIRSYDYVIYIYIYS